ncbi:F-box/FBD/LRR-repeat protein At5g56420 [Cajanus cajan]|uniref:F-box/FBD/LRR-repeat protein At5g56420 n=1 Tax=Cajanus cajan TaxID=3821 RepID=UPI00098DD0E1|nr:F-box/FBD/LRR-repeat protein At5g56420 [Cajanus cajan]
MSDRISCLPDTLLIHILLLLPIKEAVATSVLAKRWRPLWLSLPTLHFNDQNYLQNKDTYSRFLQLVYTVMLLRDASQPIQSFNLECESPLCNTFIVNAWVTAAIQLKVECLSLSLSSTVNLPSCILTSTNLVVLNLKGLTVKSVSSVSLPSLKTLHLRWVRFLERKFLFEVLSSCPVLEDLLMSFVLLTKQSLGGQIKSLPKLIKADISECDFTIPIAEFYKAEFLRIEVIKSLPKLIKADISECDFTIPIAEFYKAEFLRIEVKYFGTINSWEESWVYPQSVPNCLSSQLKRCSLKNYDGRQHEVGFAKYIMQNARVLYDLTIQSRSSDLEIKFRMIKDLSTCPRISATCEINFL